MLSVGPLKHKCEEMFNHPKDCTPVRKVLVFGMMFQLCIEYSEDDRNASLATRYSVLARIFFTKFEAAISELPLIIPPSSEAITSLIIGVSSLSDFA